MTPAQCRAARKRLGLTLTGMAESLPVDRQTWWRWENGVQEPPRFLWRAVEHLADELGPQSWPDPTDVESVTR